MGNPAPFTRTARVGSGPANGGTISLCRHFLTALHDPLLGRADGEAAEFDARYGRVFGLPLSAFDAERRAEVSELRLELSDLRVALAH